MTRLTIIIAAGLIAAVAGAAAAAVRHDARQQRSIAFRRWLNDETSRMRCTR